MRRNVSLDNSTKTSDARTIGKFKGTEPQPTEHKARTPITTHFVAAIRAIRRMPDTSKFLLTLTGTGEWILRPAGTVQPRKLGNAAHPVFEVEGEDGDDVAHVDTACTDLASESSTSCFDTDLMEAWLYFLGRMGEISLQPRHLYVHRSRPSPGVSRCRPA